MAAGDVTQGARLQRGHDVLLEAAAPGSYGSVERDGSTVWYVKTPNGHVGDVSQHDVVEHDDGTITVSPSILVSDHRGEPWHGYLERGVWREV